jgi:hypothetical protein
MLFVFCFVNCQFDKKETVGNCIQHLEFASKSLVFGILHYH